MKKMLLVLVLGILLAPAAHATRYIAHIVDGQHWATIFFIVNPTDRRQEITVWFVGDDGNPMELPVPGLGMTNGFSVDLLPHNMTTVETLGTSPSERWGSAIVDFPEGLNPNPSVTAVFRQRVPGRADFEASVPMANPRQGLVMAFDHRVGYQTGVALSNPNNRIIDIVVHIRDAHGRTLEFDSIQMAPFAHQAFSVSQKYRSTREAIGTIRFDSQGTVGIVGIGIRFNPTGPFTTVPPVAGSFF